KRRARPASRTAALVNTTPRLCRAAGALYFLAFEGFLAAHIDFNLLRLGFGFLCKLDLQDPLVIVRLNVLGINRVRKRERTSEAAILPLNPAEVLFFLFLLELALAVNGKRVVLNPDIDIFLVDSRHFDLQRNVVLVLVNVYQRGKRRGGQCFLAALAIGVAEQTI